MRLFLLIVALLMASCGRTPLPNLDGGPAADGPSADRTLLPDHRRRDTSPLPACAALAGFAKGKRVSTSYARKARFSPSLKRLALVTHQDNAPGDLYLLSLPSAKATLVAHDVHDVTWLPNERGLLIKKEKGKTSSVPYDLQHASAAGAKLKILGSDLCTHVVTPDGSRVYMVAGCDQKHRGSLTVAQVDSGASSLLATGVAATSLVVSPDSKWAAYVLAVSIPAGCYYDTGTSILVNAAGKKTGVTGDVMPSSQQFTPTNMLLARRMVCKNKTQELTFVIASATSGTVSLQVKESEYDFYGYGFYTGQRYSVSADGKQVLMSRPHDKSLQHNDLLTLSTHDGKIRVLASDMYPYQMTSMAFRVWTYANRGRHVVYVRGGGYPTMGLAAMPASGGKALVLANSLHGATYVISRESTDAAWIEYSSPTTMEVMYGSVSSSAKSLVLASHKEPIHSLSLVPGGRGVLFVQRSGTTKKLVEGSAGGGSRVLGQWGHDYLTASYDSAEPPVRGYSVDRQGCAVVYNQDRPGVARGTFLRQIFPN